ncbi:MAG: pseudouridine-5'-phosphate glycosidase [Gemmataceae bacterium]|nr:pseudouridine-5'-phosphate glycosidase [Gemmataceae bacterium]
MGILEGGRPVIRVHPEVAAALAERRPVVALESTLIAHGLPSPLNLQVAREAELAVRAEGAVPATVAVVAGAPAIGLSPDELEKLATRPGVRKAGRRDLAVAVARGEWAATTVSATMLLAHRAGIRVFATGGIGGVHPGSPADVSADLPELGRTPVAVVCAGAKSILDLPATLEMLETLGVPVVGYGTEEFPAFYTRSSGLRLAAHVGTPEEAAALMQAHWRFGGAGVVLALPITEEQSIPAEELASAMTEAEKECPPGPARTPWLLSRLAELTGGRTLTANRSLVLANAALAARIAAKLEG